MATIGRIILYILLACTAQAAAAQQVMLPFTGRLVDDQGKVIAGEVDLQVGFYRTDSGGEAVAIPPQKFPHTTLDAGVFRVNVEVQESQIKTLFPLASSVAFLQVQDLTHDRTYRRHPVSMTDLTVLKTPTPAGSGPGPAQGPAAAAVAPTSSGAAGPVGSVLAPAPVNSPTVATAGAASLNASDAAAMATAGACLAVAGTGAKFTVRSSDKTAPCQAVCATAKTGAQCLRGWTLFVNAQIFEFGNECGAVQITPSLPAEGHICCCLSQSSPEAVRLAWPQSSAP